jgi:hypothetical protein
MAGIVLTTDGRDWGVSSSAFYWAIDALAARVQNPDLATRLREISEYNLGSLNVGSLPDAEQHDLATAVRELPTIARAELPASSEREAVITQIGQLVSLFATS